MQILRRVVLFTILTGLALANRGVLAQAGASEVNTVRWVASLAEGEAAAARTGKPLLLVFR